MPALFDSMDIIVYILATWRITSLLADGSQVGPWGMLDKLRHAVGVRRDDVSQTYGTTMLSKLILCVYCSSPWVALGWLALRLLVPKRANRVAFPFAVSAGAIIVEEAVEYVKG